MAKRKYRKTTQLEGFAEDVGRLLGTAMAKADRWMSQRQDIVKNLTKVRDTASELLTSLGQQAQAEFAARRGRPAGSKNKGKKGIIIVGGKRKRKTRKVSPR